MFHPFALNQALALFDRERRGQFYVFECWRHLWNSFNIVRRDMFHADQQTQVRMQTFHDELQLPDNPYTVVEELRSPWLVPVY